MFLFFLSQRLFLGQGSGDCTSRNGCSVTELKEVFQTGDVVEIISRELSGSEGVHFLEFLNSSRAEEIVVVGAPTVIDGSDFRDSAVFFLEKQVITFENVTFSRFACPLFEAINSSLSLNRIEFVDIKIKTSAALAFVGSIVTMNDVIFNRVAAEAQSFVVGYQSSFELNHLQFLNSLLRSASFAPLFHALNSSVVINESLFTGNVIDMPLIDVSNESVLFISNSSFVDNEFSVVGMFEYGASANLQCLTFVNHTGSLVFASDNINITMNNVTMSATSERQLIDVTGSRLESERFVVANSSLSGVMTSSNSVSRFVKSIFRAIESASPLFEITQGSFELTKSRLSNISSKCDTPIAATASCWFVSKKTRMSSLSSSIDTATSFSFVSSEVFIENLEHLDTSCGFGIVENSQVSISKCDIINNQCFPTDSSLPFAIFSLFNSGLTLTAGRFRNNRAITGTLLLVNSSCVMKDSVFESNSAVQGAAVFGQNGTLIIDHSRFHKNTALATGGVMHLNKSTVSAKLSSFSRNQCDEGGVLYSTGSTPIGFHHCDIKGNEAAVGTFLSVRGNESFVFLEKVRIDLMPDRAISVDVPANVQLNGTFFNCDVYCQLIDDLTMQTQIPSLSFGPAFAFVIVLAPIGLILSSPRLRRRLLRKLRQFKSKGKNTA